MVSIPKKWLKTPITVSSSSVGSLSSAYTSIQARADAPLHQTEEGGIERVSLFQLVRVLTQKQISGVDQVANDQSEHFSKVQTRNHLFKCLLVGLVGGFIDDNVVFRSRQVLVLKRVERSPFAVDGHTGSAWKTNRVHLGDVLGCLHVGRVTSGTENDRNLGVRVDVVGGDKGTGGIVDQGGKLAWDVLRCQLVHLLVFQPAH